LSEGLLTPRFRAHQGAVDADANVVSFVRHGRDEDALVCVANFSGEEVCERRTGLPGGGTWHEVLNTGSFHWLPASAGETKNTDFCDGP